MGKQRPLRAAAHCGCHCDSPRARRTDAPLTSPARRLCAQQRSVSIAVAVSSVWLQVSWMGSAGPVTSTSPESVAKGD